MNLYPSKTILLVSMFICCFLAGCQDLEKLFAGKKKNAEKSVASVAVNPPRTDSPAAIAPEFKASCFLLDVKVPANLEVYAVDGQATIDQSAFAKAHPKAITSISVTLDSPEPSALILTAKQAALWEIKTTQRTQLWAVYVTGESTQIIEGVNKPTLLREHYRESGDTCGFYWAPELQVHGLYDFSRKLFGKPYISLTKADKGVAEIKALSPPSMIASDIDSEESTRRIEAAVRDQANSGQNSASMNQKNAAPHHPMSLEEGLRRNILRPGNLNDVEQFKSRFLSANNKPFHHAIGTNRLYVITSEYTFSGKLYGANAVVFLIADGAPYPLGDSGHSLVLDMKSGTALNRISSQRSSTSTQPQNNSPFPLYPISLEDGLSRGILRPGNLNDVARFKARYLDANKTPLLQEINANRLYVITSDYTYADDLYGAHSVDFLIEVSAPYPRGNPGHSRVLDMKSGTCLNMGCR